MSPNMRVSAAGGHRGVGSQGWQNAAQAVAIVFIGVSGQRASLGVEAAAIRRHGQNLALRARAGPAPAKARREETGGKAQRLGRPRWQ